MIAPKAVPRPAAVPRRIARARDASRRRARRTQMRGYAHLGRIVAALFVVLVPVMGYVVLTTNLTGMNYALAHATQEKLALQEETMRLEDEIAHLRSRDRLSDVAASLKMHDPRLYAVVDVPVPSATPPANGLALLESLFVKRP